MSALLLIPAAFVSCSDDDTEGGSPYFRLENTVVSSKLVTASSDLGFDAEAIIGDAHARTDPLRHPFELQLECRMQLHGRRLDQILPQDRPGRRQGTLLPGGQRCQHPAFGDGRIPLCGRQADRNDPRRQPERQRTLHQVRRQQHRDERDRSGTLCRPLRHQGRVERDAVLRTRKSRMGNLHRDGQRDFHARHRGVSRAAGIPEP